MSTFQSATFNGSCHARDFSDPAHHAPILVTVTGIKSNLWSVESSDDSVGGIFVSRKAALAFAHEAMVSSNAAVVLNEDRIMTDEQRFGHNFLDMRGRGKNAPIQRPNIVGARRGSDAAHKPLFNEREIAIGFSMLTLAAAVFALA